MTNNNIMMMLGGFKFEVGKTGYSELSESFSWKWNEVEKAKGLSSLQFQAKNLETKSLKGLVSTVAAGLNCFDTLINEANKGEPLTLVDGLGNFLGRYVIENINKTSESFIRDGLPRAITFDMSIKQYD